jgi:conjugative transposon TraN protein
MSINMKRLRIFGLAAVALLSAAPVMAQKTMDDMQYLTINENVTTVITASEPVRFVDISTDKVAGDQPISNLVRLKPKEGMEIHHDGDVLAVVTIVTERYRSQYALIYTSRMDEAVTEKTITLDEREPYNNPAVSMSTEDMTRYARQIWASPARVRNVSTKRNRMVMRLNNIYSVGEYFFIDFSVDNRTNIRFDIDQLRVKLNDKKTARSTTVQTIELIPELVLDPTRSFRYGYRNVIVLKKMTFPNDKMLTIELSEQQISGRTISLSIEYEDVLNADSFNNVLLMEN